MEKEKFKLINSCGCVCNLSSDDVEIIMRALIVYLIDKERFGYPKEIVKDIEKVHLKIANLCY